MRLCLTLVLAACALATPARADEGPLRLTWTAPPGCPSAEQVRTATMRGAAGRASEGALEAHAKVEREDERWRVHLRTRRGDATGEREIAASTCAGVADATAVLLALALVPPGEAPAEPTTSARAGRGSSESAAGRGSSEAAGDAAAAAGQGSSEAAAGRGSSEAAGDVAAERARRGAGRGDRDRHAVALGASIAGGAAALPSAAVGGSLTVAWTPGRARLELDARRWASQSQTLPGSSAGARFTMTSLGARGCWALLRRGGFEVAPCGGADVVVVSADGYGADANHSPGAAWTALAGGALGRLALAPWLSLRARVEALAPLSRPAFVVENEGTVHRPPALGAEASVGLEANFL